MKELDTHYESFNETDPEKIEQFEKAWLENKPLEIADCLPAKSDPTYKGTLEELTHIDREFRWKNYYQSSPEKLRTLESYWEHYPALLEFKLGLIQGEFQLANRFLPEVSVDQFVERFGESIDGKELRQVLNQRLQQWTLLQPVRPGSTLGRYQIVNEHGRGGFGAVWRAKDTKLGRRIAVKQLGQRLAHDAESRRRFISEARVTARLEHPGIVPVYDISQVEEDHAYYTMRLIQGRTMGEAINDLFEHEASVDEFRLRRRKLLQSFIDVCRTIEYAHAQGVIHRDLKPQNIIVGDYGETIILDWGLASVTAEAKEGSEGESLSNDPDVLSPEESIQTLQGNAVGTPAYMPPEQANGDIENISFHSDIYSLGATLYHLVSDTVPVNGKTLNEILSRVISGDIPSVDTIYPKVEKPLAAIVSTAMAKDPNDRYANVGAMADDIQRFLADQPVSTFTDPFGARIARTIRKHPTATAMIGICALFIVVALSAAWVINNAWKTREVQRVSNLRVAAERADVTSLAHIANGRFDSAVKSLKQARELIQNEPALSELSATLTAREKRTQKILMFYDLGGRAQESTFLDRTGASSRFCQAAVNQLGVLDHPDWWNSLPDEDLPPLQREELRTEVYRILTLLASMRLAEVSDETISLKMLLKPQKMVGNPKAAQSLKAAKFAAAAANRFRPSRAMQLIEHLAEFSLDQRNYVDMKNLNPLNATDSAVMGSILDNNVWDGIAKNMASLALEMRDPNEVAKQWLQDALRESPSWYWIPVFIGNSQTKTGQPEAAIQTLSHAVGVRPNFWIGYQYRAWAAAIAAQNEKSSNRKFELLNAASRDIQRALDVQPYFYEIYWASARIQIMQSKNPNSIAETFLIGFSLHPNLEDIESGHLNGITRELFGLAKKFVETQKAAKNDSAKIRLLELVVALWSQNYTEAESIAASALATHQSDQDLLAMRQMVLNRQKPESAKPIEFDASSLFVWHYQFSNAKLLGQQKRYPDQFKALANTLKNARATWQQVKTQLATAICCAHSGNMDEAGERVKKTYELDQSVQLRSLQELAVANEWQAVVESCRSVLNQTNYRTTYNDHEKSPICFPALLNGGFELGLTSHWAPYVRRKTATVWNNQGESNSVAETTNKTAHHGNQCLHLILDSPNDDKSYGWMSQSVPVTPGETYQVQVWLKTENVSQGGVEVGIQNEKPGSFKHSVAVDNGTSDWQKKEFKFTADQSSIQFGIKATGAGQAWIDHIQISRAEN